MDAFKTAVTVSLPTYLAGLPIPTELAGFAALTSDQWFQLAPVLLVIIAHVLILTSFFTSGEASGKINKSIKLEEPKVCASACAVPCPTSPWFPHAPRMKLDSEPDLKLDGTSTALGLSIEKTLI